MAKKQGKVKAISVKEVTDGMQVLTNRNSIAKVIFIDGDIWVESMGYLTGQYQKEYSISDIKVLVVEYIEELHNDFKKIRQGYPNRQLKQIPLKYSQWQTSLNKNEVDCDKIVDFEINGYEHTGQAYAKIIPQKNKLYTEEELIDLLGSFGVYLGKETTMSQSYLNNYKNLMDDEASKFLNLNQ